MDTSVADYAEHLTEADLRLLFTVALGPTTRKPRWPAIRRPSRGCSPIRGYSRPFRRAAVTAGHAVLVSPFLAFGVAVHRAVADLSGLDYLPERSGAAAGARV